MFAAILGRLHLRQLTLDLGSLPAANLERELPLRLANALRSQLQRLGLRFAGLSAAARLEAAATLSSLAERCRQAMEPPAPPLLRHRADLEG